MCRFFEFYTAPSPSPLPEPPPPPLIVTNSLNSNILGFSTTRYFSLLVPRQVPPQHEPSALEKDARKAVGAILQRVGTAAARANRSLVVVLQMRDALRKDNSKKTRAAQEAAKWKKTKGMAYDTLKLARAEESAVKKQYKGCSRPRRVLRYIMAGWESEVEKAARLADEADRVYRLSRAEAGAAREVACRCAQEEEATELFLRRAELAHASAVKIFHALEAAAARAEDRAVYAVNAVGVGRCWAKEVYARGGGDKIDPLLVAAELAASVEDGFTDDQVWSAALSSIQHTLQ